MEKTWKQATERWQKEGEGRHPETVRRENQFLRWLDLGDMSVEAFDAEFLHELRDKYRDEGQSPRSVNYMIGFVRSVLRACQDWGWRDAYVPRVRRLREPTVRSRWLRPDEAKKLVAALPEPINDMCAFALDTGLRKGNVSGLLWAWCDLRRGRVDIPAEVMKARAAHSVPLTRRCRSILDRRWKVRQGAYVFHRQGRPIWQPNGKRWKAALDELGLEGFRWHDLRHTWASHHAQAGTEVQVLRQMGAWKTLHMVSRYAHLDLRPAERAQCQLEAWRG